MLPKSVLLYGALWLFCVQILDAYPCSREEGVCVYIYMHLPFKIRKNRFPYSVFRWFYCGILFNVFFIVNRVMVCKAISRD